MQYDDTEIMARTHFTGSHLYSLTDDGELDAIDFEIKHDDDTIVWYEAPEMSHLSVKDGDKTLYFVEVEDIDELKRRIDLYRQQNPIEEE